MATNPTAMIAVSFKLANGRTVCLHENDLVKGLRFKDGNDIVVIDGSVRVLNGNTKNIAVKTQCPPESYISNLLNITSIIIDSSAEFNAELKQISISSIIDIAEILENDGAIKVGIGSQFDSLSNVIDAAPAGSTIELMNGVYEEDLVLNKSIKLFSNSGAVFNGSITVNGTVTDSTDPSTITDISIDGLYMSGNSTIKLSNVDIFGMRNCIYKDHDFTTAKTIPIIINKDNTPVKINIDNNTFGAENENSYNIIEVYGAIKSGSTFNNNRFEKDCCVHNQISLYGLDDDAVIDINNNYCEKSANMVRFGFKGNPKGIIEMRNNVYVESDTNNPDWSGLFLVQPFAKETESFADLKIVVYNTTKPAGQICYLYAGVNDTQFTDDNKPTITIDGAVVVPPILA